MILAVNKHKLLEEYNMRNDQNGLVNSLRNLVNHHCLNNRYFVKLLLKAFLMIRFNFVRYCMDRIIFDRFNLIRCINNLMVVIKIIGSHVSSTG